MATSNALSPKTKPAFSFPPVDLENLIMQIVKSNASPCRTVGEYFENSMDANANRVEMEILGTVNGDKVDMTGLIVKDNGDGMSLTTFSRNFRGFAWHNEDTHLNGSRYGKNCVGAKSGLDFFQYIDVKTTTKDKIEDIEDPDQFDNPIEHQLYKELHEVRANNSKLKPGNDDTEWRSFRMGLTETDVIQPWESCDNLEHGTIVHLHAPLPNRAITLNIEELLQSLRAHFDWLSEQDRWNKEYGETSKRKKRGLFIKIPGRNWEEILPFDNGWSTNVVTAGNPCGAYLLVTGSIGAGLSVAYTPGGELKTIPGKETIPPIELTPEEKKAFKLHCGDVDIWLQLTYGLDSRDKQLLVSISGSIVQIPWEFLDKIQSGGGFSTAIRGKISSNNLVLKDALRHNRTTLDMGSTVVQKFWNYMYTVVFKTMAEYYSLYTQNESALSDKDVFTEAFKTLSFAFPGVSRDKGEHKFSRWKCCSCDHVFQYRIGHKPIQCPECKCHDLERYTVERDPDPNHLRGTDAGKPGKSQFTAVDSLGDFLPIRFVAGEDMFQVAANHPEFTQDISRKVQWNLIKKERIIRHALTAWAAHKMGDTGEAFLQEYGRALKINYLSDLKRKRAVEAQWALSPDVKLFVDREKSSFE